MLLAASGVALLIRTSLGIGIGGGGTWNQPLPLQIQTVYRNGSIEWTHGAYAASEGNTANGTLTTPGGAVFFFTDTFSNVTALGFNVERSVTVTSEGSGDEFAFSSQFSLLAPDELLHERKQFFIPGVSYQNASSLPPNALAGDPLAAHILIREDRLPLPFVLVFYPDANGSSSNSSSSDGGGVGYAASLTHIQPNGSTIANEDYQARIVDGNLQFGSIGFLNEAVNVVGDALQLSIAFIFPGSEGDRTYVGGSHSNNNSIQWANRSHPLTLSFSHTYSLQFSTSSGSSSSSNNMSYYDAAKWAWREVFNTFAPSAPVAPLPSQLYRDEMELLAAYGIEYNGVPSMPFQASLPSGNVIDTSSQIGFVGRALPCAALLLYDAVLVSPNATRRLQAEAIIDLWATEAMNPCGVPKTWYDIKANKTISWRASDAYMGSIRIMSDGMKGLLDAWTVLPANEKKDTWLAAAQLYGNFLISHLSEDGEIVSAWDWNCQPLSFDTRQSVQVIPFLVELYRATNDTRYYDGAVSAGTYGAALFTDHFEYTGGAVDNPDVPDKEAGWLAAQGFIALFELTLNATWLEPAAQAATYSETFVYAWDIPIQCVQSPANTYPCHRTTLGVSLIATGKSNSDNYMAIAWFDYKKLGEWLADDHFLAFSTFLQAATTQAIDWDGSLGYASKGLLSEAMTVSVRRGSGVESWLPWLTANILYPLVQRGVMNETRFS